MRSLIVPLADMIPHTFTRAARQDAVELPASDDEPLNPLSLLDDEGMTREARAAADAAVVLLCHEDALVARLDFRRVRALVEREVQVSRGGPVHLTPLYVYLDAFSCAAVATRVVLAIADALARLGLSVQVPAGPRGSEARRRRQSTTAGKQPVKQAAREPERSRRAVGTRAGWLAWA